MKLLQQVHFIAECPGGVDPGGGGPRGVDPGGWTPGGGPWLNTESEVGPVEDGYPGLSLEEFS